MTIIDNKFAVWTDEQKLTFLEALSHNLTIAIRGVWSDDGLSPERKVEMIKWLNEIHHRVPMRARSVRLHEAVWTGPDAGLGLEQWLSQDPGNRHSVESIVEHSINDAERTQRGA